MPHNLAYQTRRDELIQAVADEDKPSSPGGRPLPPERPCNQTRPAMCRACRFGLRYIVDAGNIQVTALTCMATCALPHLTLYHRRKVNDWYSSQKSELRPK